MAEFREMPEEPGTYYASIVEYEGVEVPTEKLIVRGPGCVRYERVWLINNMPVEAMIFLDFNLN